MQFNQRKLINYGIARTLCIVVVVQQTRVVKTRVINKRWG